MTEEKLKKCVYCGKRATSVDHIPPRNLFPRPWPSDLITVPACAGCNNGASKDDEYFRSRLIIKREVGGHRAIKGVLPTLFRSLSRPQQLGFARQFASDIQLVDEFTPSGLYLGSGAGYVPDHDRLHRVVKRIAMGLFFHELRKPMPQSYEMDVGGFSNIAPWDIKAIEQFKEMIQKVVALRPATVIGDGVFAYSYQIAGDQPKCSIWALEFFESETYVGICGPKYLKARAKPRKK